MFEELNLILITFYIIEFWYLKTKIPNKYLKNILLYHIICQKLLLYIIYISSFIEIISFLINFYENYMLFVSFLDKYIVGSLLNITILSGICIAKKKYKKNVPNHIYNAINHLLILGIIWFVFDKSTQVNNVCDNFYFRIFLNIFSCSYLYYIQQIFVK